jgi:hypothetical protein
MKRKDYCFQEKKNKRVEYDSILITRCHYSFFFFYNFRNLNFIDELTLKENKMLVMNPHVAISHLS